MKSAIYNGLVTHRRLAPVGHMLRYRVFYLLIDLEELPELARKILFLSVGKLNLVSFYSSDFGQSCENLKEHIQKEVLAAGINTAISSIRLLCIPRIFGYAFNPLSTYFCYDEAERIVAIVYEVHNTFGERHSYVLEVSGEKTETAIRQSCEKDFYVSPFIPMSCRYDFTVLPPSDGVAISIRQFQDDQPILNASFVGKKEVLNNRSLSMALVKFPFNSLKVIAGIHWEALKLWLKGIKLMDRPIKKIPRPQIATNNLSGKYQEK